MLKNMRPTTTAYSLLHSQNSAEFLRMTTLRHARYTEICPMNPLTGIWITHRTVLGYRHASPNGDCLTLGTEGSTSVTFTIVHCSFYIVHCFTFSAKEKDPETGLSYFGSRYYSSDLSVWLSVDPQASKYPSLSPYVYCADNPVKLVDPNGEEVWIIGDDATAVTKAFEQLQSSTSYILKLGDNGKVEIIGGKAEYDDDRLLAKAINDNTIRVNVTAINGNSDDNVLGGAFMGNKVSTVKPSFILPKPFQIIQGIAARCVNTYQTVDPFELEILDNIGVNSDGTKAWPGQCMLHEVTESYCGGILAYKSGISAGNALKSPFAYNIAHNAATAQPDFDAEDKWQLNEMVRQIRKK